MLLSESRNHETAEHPMVPFANYVYVWLGLLALTTLSIVLAKAVGGAGILFVFLITPLKAWLVLYYFMHLKYESDYFKTMFTIVLLVLAVFIGGTFVDVAFR